MSYDVTLTITAGTTDTVEVFTANHTCNTAVMWREAGCDLAEFHGRRADALRDALAPAVADIDLRPEHYARWNPKNRWGSVETTVGFLRDLLKACTSYPLATVEVSR